MNTVVIVAVIVVMGCVLLLLFAVDELRRGLEQLRDTAGLDDRMLTIDLGSALGERSPIPDLGQGDPHVLLYLSDKCATCRGIASDLERGFPKNLVVVVEGPVADDGWQPAHRLNPNLTVVDTDGRLAREIGLNVTPLAVVVVSSRMIAARSLSSARSLRALLGDLEGFTREPLNHSSLGHGDSVDNGQVD